MAENKNTAVKKNKALKFFRETKSEMKKVSWPSKNQLFHNTIVILAFVIIVTIILSLLDVGFEKLLSFIVR
ncbi:MAG: preprotein translocase subunit SecE [Clostridia bacterium]|nr:preprotein translocase subunit SecE [Clostridia bacterium]